MELTREVLEAVRNDRCDMPLCSDCIFSMPKGHPDARLVSKLEDVWCSHPGLITVATFALALMDERDRLRMQVRAAEDVIAKASAAISGETDEGLYALTSIQAWQITPTDMYYRDEAEMEAAHAEADQ
jgi:hypothetical protein